MKIMYKMCPKPKKTLFLLFLYAFHKYLQWSDSSAWWSGRKFPWTQRHRKYAMTYTFGIYPDASGRDYFSPQRTWRIYQSQSRYIDTQYDECFIGTRYRNVHTYRFHHQNGSLWLCIYAMMVAKIRNHLYRTKTQCLAMWFPRAHSQTNITWRDRIFWWYISRSGPWSLLADHWIYDPLFYAQQYLISSLQKHITWHKTLKSSYSIDDDRRATISHRTYDELKNSPPYPNVIPALSVAAGIHAVLLSMDSRFRGNDAKTWVSYFIVSITKLCRQITARPKLSSVSIEGRNISG